MNYREAIRLLSALQAQALISACVGDIVAADATQDPLVRKLGECIRLCAEAQARTGKSEAA